MSLHQPHVDLLREMLEDLEGISEKRMFGGLCFLLHGNMLCGIHKSGGMIRVGKEREAAALSLSGVSPLTFTGRKMGGMCDVDSSILVKDSQPLQSALDLAVAFVSSLPAK